MLDGWGGGGVDALRPFAVDRKGAAKRPPEVQFALRVEADTHAIILEGAQITLHEIWGSL